MKNFQTKFINKTIKLEKKFLSGLEKPLLPIFISRLLLENNKVLFIAKNDKEMSNVEEFANKLNQNMDILSIPCWDSLPYDVSSPNRIIKATSNHQEFNKRKDQVFYSHRIDHDFRNKSSKSWRVY